MTGPNLRGLNKTIKALELSDAHLALVVLARSLAAAVDADPCADCGAGQNAALWKEYRTAVTVLTEVGAPDDDDDDTKDWLVRISTPSRATVGNGTQP